MSAQATLNLVDDEEMSSQGSVNAPVARPSSPLLQGQQPTQQKPSGLPPWPGMPMVPFVIPATKAPDQQSVVTGFHGRKAATTTPIQSTEVVATPTVPVDTPTRAETKQAFAEVSSALRDVSSQHDEVRAGMQSLASGVEVAHVPVMWKQPHRCKLRCKGQCLHQAASSSV